MAEVGLLPFARTALEVATAVLPPYRSRFSKHQFTQRQLLAVLCLMRYEDWTFRETEVRLREHRELRRVLQLGSVPDYTTLYRFLKRLDEKKIGQALGEAARRLGTVGRGCYGAGAGRGVSTFFVRCRYHHTGQPLPWQHWLKWLVTVDVDRQRLLSQAARRGPWNDCANCLRWWRRPIKWRPSEWCWPMRSLTVNETILLSVSSSMPGASSRPSAGRRVGASTGCEPKCGTPFPAGNMLDEPWSRPSSPPSSANFPPEHREEVC
jgi:transposase-like protein DUF772